MYNYSGIIYRLLSPCGIVLALGILHILLTFNLERKLNFHNCKTGILIIFASICFTLIHLYNIMYPDVKEYTGEFLYEHRNSRTAPPLPFTMEYIFWNGEGYKYGFYLDIFSMKEIYPEGFTVCQKYTIYYEDATNVIIGVEIAE